MNLGELVDILGTDGIGIKYLDKENRLLFEYGNSTFPLIVDNPTNVKPEPSNVNSQALVNQINKKKVEDYMDLIELSKSVIPDLTHYCISCGDRLEFQSDEYITCGSKDCDYKFEEMKIGDNVIERVKYIPESLSLHLRMGFKAIDSGRREDVFEPFPEKFLLYGQKLTRGQPSALSGNNKGYCKDFSKLLAITNRWKNREDKLVKLVLDCEKDMDIIETLGRDAYHLIRFITLSCKADLSPIKIKDAEEVACFKVSHYFDREEEFKRKVQENGASHYFFHGSKWANWYSITRNGLKNCSNSKLMLHGSLQGEGIYFTNSFSLSFGHCDGPLESTSIIGVFEIADDPEKYFKGGNIYVFPDEEKIIIRYILVAPVNLRPGITRVVENYFLNDLKKEEVGRKSLIFSKGMKKLVREYKKIAKLDPKQSGFRVKVSDTDAYRWYVTIDSRDNDSNKTFMDMKRYGVETIELELIFPENYPFSPPFARIVKPVFKSLTGHITDGGAVCMQLLTNRYWSPVYSIESLVINIVSEILEGEGEIDPDQLGKYYSLTGARSSFVKMATGHGWI